MSTRVPTFASVQRKTVGTRIYAKRVYPKVDSPKAGTSVMVNVIMSDGETLNLARHLIQAAREAKEVTVAVTRKPLARNEHSISVTYEARMKKDSVP